MNNKSDNQDWIVLFDYDKRPIGRVLARKNLTPEWGTGVVIPARTGVWATNSYESDIGKQYYACYYCENDKRKTWAEIITQPEAQYFLIENPEEYALLFGNDGLAKIPCFDPEQNKPEPESELVSALEAEPTP